MAPTILKHYRIVRPIGQGGMGEVYLAEDTKLGRQVALKILPEHLAARPGDLERFEREARAVAAFNHPNIVTLHSVEEDNGVHFLTMELVDGEPLSARIPPTGLPLDALLRFAIPIADAVGAAHDRGIVHRDLKPANVMVTSDGRVKVLDFGLAKLATPTDSADELPTQQLTGEGRIVGTAAYMSPEQAEGKDVDHRTDVFSMGVLLYEMATGRRPFTGATSASVISAVIKDTPRSASDVNPAVPVAVSRLIKTCLQKDRDRRYQSIKDVRNELQTLKEELDSGELAAQPQRGTQAAAVVPQRSWLLLGLGAGAVAVAVVLYLMFGRGAAPLSDVPVMSFAPVTSSDAYEAHPSLSHDGEWLVYTSAPAGNADIFLLSIGGQNAINLTADNPADDFSPAFSPEGTRIAFVSTRDGGGIFVMGRTGESPRRLTRAGFSPAWSPDGQHIVYADQITTLPTNRGGASALRIVDVDSGDERVLIEADGMNPSWSPNGRFIAYWGLPTSSAGFGSAHRDIRVVPAAGGDPVMLTDDAAVDWLPVWSAAGDAVYFSSDRGGSMNLWRVGVDPDTGRPTSEPVSLTAPAQYVGGLTMSGDGRRLVYQSTQFQNNYQRVAFDPASSSVTGALEPVTTGSRHWVWGDVSPDGQSIVMSQAFVGQEDVYRVGVDGAGLRQLSDDSFFDRNPRWSPDGSRIAFYSNRSGAYEVWTIAPDGSDLRQITKAADGALWPTWSPDGAQMAYTDYDSASYLIDLRGSVDEQTPERLPDVPDTPGRFFLPFDWSDEGGLLGVVGTTEGPMIMTYDVALRRYDRVTTGGDPAWLRDGRIVYAAPGNTIRIIDPRTGRSSELLTLPDDQSIGSLRVSADNHFLYLLTNGAEADLWLAEVANPPSVPR